MQTTAEAVAPMPPRPLTVKASGNAAKQLLAQATDGGGPDNITLLVVRFDPADSAAGDPGDAREKRR